MALVHLPVRYCELTPPEGTPWREENFELQTLTWDIDPEQAALVMVDVWDIHPYESHLERGGEITRDRLVPVADACRAAGVTVVHAPSPGQAVKYPQWVRYAGDREVVGPSASEDSWPPKDFRSRTGEYARFAKPEHKRRQDWLADELPKRAIMPCIEPKPADFVVQNGDQLHRLLRHRGILHLFYAGFATNMCVLHRDYGIIAMQKRGYNIVLLRDCTVGIESAETVADMVHTRAAVSIVEMIFGVTATSEQFIAACHDAGES
jgi:nicotinamidase-related amidase